MDEKSDKNLLLPSQLPPVSNNAPRRPRGSLAKVVVILTLFLFAQCMFWTTDLDLSPSVSEELCPQDSEFVPDKNGEIWQTLSNSFSSDDFKAKAIDWLADAVRIP